MKLKVSDYGALLGRARSLKEIMSVVENIGKEIDKTAKQVSAFITSVSSGKILISLSSDEITIDHSGSGRRKPQAKLTTSTKLSAFSAPKLQTLVKHMDVLDRLHGLEADLAVAAALVKQDPNVKTAGRAPALKAIKNYQDEISALTTNALNALSALAEKHVPSEMDEMCDRLMLMVDASLRPGSYSALEHFLYTTVHAEDFIHFSYYIQIDGLKDSSGFEYDNYFVVLTGIVSTKAATPTIAYYLNTLMDFKIPGRYPLGKAVTSEAEVKARLANLLSAIDVVSELGKKAMPVSKERLARADLKTKIPGIISATVENEELRVQIPVKATPSAINKILTSLLPAVQSLVGNTRAKVKHRIEFKGTKKYIVFVLVANGTRSGMDESKLADVRLALDLSDGEVDALREALRSGA